MLMHSSNWRGPIWFAVNFLLVESLLRFFMFYGKSLKIECPTDSGVFLNLGEVAEEIQHRLQHLFIRGEDGRRPANDGDDVLDFDPHWKDYLWFHEFFDGDTGRGIGASHQCGWTGLVCKIIHDAGLNCRLPSTPKTPTRVAAHYADSYFDETFDRPTRNHIRRSSTSRSIGRRGSFGTSVNGDHSVHSEVEDEEDDARRTAEKQNVAEYVSEQLDRMRSNESLAVYEDEFKTQVDSK